MAGKVVPGQPERQPSRLEPQSEQRSAHPQLPELHSAMQQKHRPPELLEGPQALSTHRHS